VKQGIGGPAHEQVSKIARGKEKHSSKQMNLTTSVQKQTNIYLGKGVAQSQSSQRPIQQPHGPW
jgi:hypothetical protein